MAKLLGTELSTRMYRITSAFNDALYSATNEPSLGMYRIQEHVSVTVPRLVEQQQYLRENCQRVEGASYDIEYDTKTLKDMAGITQFTGIRNKYIDVSIFVCLYIFCLSELYCCLYSLHFLSGYLANERCCPLLYMYTAILSSIQT